MEYGIESPSEVTGASGVSITCRECDEARYVFVLNCVNADREVDVRGEFNDLLTDRKIKGKYKLSPFEVLVFKTK